MELEKMDSFFNKRAEIYDDHMLTELNLNEFYEEISKTLCSAESNFNLLDLGCGTGLELERLFMQYPDMKVTGIDMSREMLSLLKSKYHDKQLDLICGSYFDADFAENTYGYALSTYSMHHFSEELKLSLYKKIYASLKIGGVFIAGDYTVKTMEEQLFYISENERLRKESGIADGFYHYDTPFTVETEVKLLNLAGFSNIKVVKEWESITIIAAEKE